MINHHTTDIYTHPDNYFVEYKNHVHENAVDNVYRRDNNTVDITDLLTKVAIVINTVEIINFYLNYYFLQLDQIVYSNTPIENSDFHDKANHDDWVEHVRDRNNIQVGIDLVNNQIDHSSTTEEYLPKNSSVIVH